MTDAAKTKSRLGRMVKMNVVVAARQATGYLELIDSIRACSYSASCVDRRSEAIRVLDGLALRQLEHDPLRPDVVALQDRQERGRVELRGLERPRRHVQVQIEVLANVDRAAEDHLERRPAAEQLVAQMGIAPPAGRPQP